MDSAFTMVESAGSLKIGRKSKSESRRCGVSAWIGYGIRITREIQSLTGDLLLAGGSIIQVWRHPG